MRLLTIVQLTVGLALSGCTFNHHSSVNRTIDMYAPVSSGTYMPPTSVWEGVVQPTPEKPTPEAPGAHESHCDAYKPLRISAPKQVDMQDIRSARTEKEISRVLLENIGTLNKQINDFNARQDRHYRAWRKRCTES